MGRVVDRLLIALLWIAVWGMIWIRVLCAEPEMTTAQIDNLRAEAMTLTEAERAQLASELVASLDGPADGGLEKAWDVEICRRINEIEAGKAPVLDAGDVLAGARVRIRGR